MLASAWASLPVNRLRHLALAPFIFAAVVSSRNQASLPYVSNEVTAVLYIFIFMPHLIFALNTCRRSPIRDIAMPTLRLTSYTCPPLAEKTEPRYLNLKTFSSVSFSHVTAGSRSWRSCSFCSQAVSSALVPACDCSLSGRI